MYQKAISTRSNWEAQSQLLDQLLVAADRPHALLTQRPNVTLPTTVGSRERNEPPVLKEELDLICRTARPALPVRIRDRGTTDQHLPSHQSSGAGTLHGEPLPRAPVISRRSRWMAPKNVCPLREKLLEQYVLVKVKDDRGFEKEATAWVSG